MNYLNWNCRGLGQSQAALELTNLVKKHFPSILFLMETKSKDHNLKKLCSKLHLENVFIKTRINTGGGLALYWKAVIDLKVLDSTPTYIDAVVNPGMDDAWRLTSFYGNPITTSEEHSWALLKHLCLKLDLPWLCVWVFNKITKAEENACKSSLQTWSRISFGNIRRLLTQKKKQFTQAEAMSMAGAHHDQIRVLRSEMYELMVKEGCLWHQRSRVDWLKNGDMSTSYLHNRVTQRNKRNFISKLNLNDGSVVTDDKHIGEALVDYFKLIFTSTMPSSFDQILEGINTKVTPAINADLTKEFIANEVELALKQMKLLIAPGLDGMSPILFKSCWNFIGQDVIDASLAILNSSNMPASLNHTYISLIPKNKISRKSQ